MKYISCVHTFIFYDSEQFCVKCGLEYRGEGEQDSPPHHVEYVEGFGTCVKCGLCMQTMLDYQPERKVLNEVSLNLNLNSDFEDILFNNNIYHISDISEVYKDFKSALKGKKIDRIYIFGYATYFLLRKKNEFRSIDYLAKMFRADVKKFRKMFCTIMTIFEDNQNQDASINQEYYFSLVYPFLQRYKMKKLVDKVLQTILNVKDKFDGTRASVIAAGSTFYVLELEKFKIKSALHDSPTFFGCSAPRALKFKRKLQIVINTDLF